MNSKTKKTATKIALLLGLFAFVIWSVLGAGASLAWFTDKSPAVKNVFNFGELEMQVSYKNDKMSSFEAMKFDTDVFSSDDLYEPGYTEVVYLKVKNTGTMPFVYKLSIDVNSVTTGVSVLGNEIYLPNYLRYGAVFGENEVEIREKAREIATEEMANLKFNTFSQQDTVKVDVGEERYIALTVYMPEDVGNAANYRRYENIANGSNIPTVELGITVFAEQTKE